MAVALYEQGRCQHWDEFRSRLIGEIAAWEQQQSAREVPWHYYTRWLAALERLVVEKGMLSTEEIAARTAEVLSGAWDEEHTHHHGDGEPHQT
jgi:nitrile hydratase accessory protein